MDYCDWTQFEINNKDRTITYIMSESMNIEAVNSLFPYMYHSHMYLMVLILNPL